MKKENKKDILQFEVIESDNQKTSHKLFLFVVNVMLISFKEKHYDSIICAQETRPEDFLFVFNFMFIRLMKNIMKT